MKKFFKQLFCDHWWSMKYSGLMWNAKGNKKLGYVDVLICKRCGKELYDVKKDEVYEK